MDSLTAMQKGIDFVVVLHCLQDHIECKQCPTTGLVRAFGPELAEVPLLATRLELQGNGLAPLLLRSLELALLEAGVSRVIMPALPLPEVPLPDQALLPGRQNLVCRRLWNLLQACRCIKTSLLAIPLPDQAMLAGRPSYLLFTQ